MSAEVVNFTYNGNVSNFSISPDAFVGVLGSLIVLGFIFLFLFALILVGLYVYLSFAYMAVGRKAKLEVPELAWIPFVGPTIIAFQTSKMHWWPWLLIVGFFIPFVNFVFMIIFGVFSIIWLWKMYESVKRPGWWAILHLILFVGLVLIGIAAWGKK